MGIGVTYAHLVGRDADLAAVADLLSSSRVVTLTGPGGVGKTRIAEQLLAGIAASDGEEPVLVRLDQVGEPTLLGHPIAAAAGVRAPGDPSDPDYLVTHLRDRRTTIVLDNCEHLVDGVAALVAALVVGCPDVRVLATSQIPLGIAAEFIYPVLPLALPAPGDEADLVNPPAAVAMFVDRARAAVPGFALTPENAAAVGAVVRAVDGLPLAIQLAAARLRMHSLGTLAARVAGSPGGLAHEFRDAPPRHHSLAASIRWIAELCSADELELWSRLSVFVGGFELIDAERVCAGDGIAWERVVDLLAGLVDKSVVQWSSEGGDRYQVLASVRAFGAARLTEHDAVAVWRERHLSYFADVAAELRASWIGPDQVRWLQRLDPQGGNFRAAFDFALEADETVPTALRMCVDLKPYWVASGLLGEGRLWADRALSPGIGTAHERAMAAQTGGLMAVLQGDPAHARAMTRVAQDCAIADSDDFVRGAIAHVEGQVLLWDGETSAGLHTLRESVRRLRQVPFSYELLGTLVVVGANLAEHGAPEEGTALLEEVVAIGERTGEGALRGHAMAWLALHDELSVGRADEVVRGALQQSWELRDLGAITTQLEVLAHLALNSGDRERCAVLLGAAASQWRRMDLGFERMPAIANASYERFEFRQSVPDELPRAHARGTALSLEDAVRIALEGEEPAPEPPAPHDVLPPLTRRETEVARMVADGLANRDIATRLFISERTAQGHVQNTLRKLDVGSRAQIATWVVRQEG